MCIRDSHGVVLDLPLADVDGEAVGGGVVDFALGESGLFGPVSYTHLGWEVTDLTVTLVGGQSHIFHTHPLDFIVATPMAMMDGLARVGTGLLEPMLQARITLPEALSGKLLSELIRLRGTYEAPIARDGMVTVDSLVPVATTMDQMCIRDRRETAPAGVADRGCSPPGARR